jgi:hypothetical protein
MSNRAEIHIQLTGSSAGTISKRASSLYQLANSVNALSKAAANMPNVGTAATRYASSLQRAGRATDRMRDSAKSAGNALDNFGTLFARMVRIMAAFTIITVVTGAIRDMVVALVQAPAQMELWNAQLRTLSGSATIAAEKLKLLQTVAIETPLELPDLFQGLTTLRAFNVEMSDRTLPLIADLAAVSGRTFQDISEVVGKVIQGSATAITRSLPTIGIDPQIFRQRAEEVGSRAEALFQLIEERFKGFAKESAKTTIGIVSNIKDAAFVIAADVGEGLLGAFRPIVLNIFNTLNAIRENEEVLDDLRSTLFGVGQGFVSFGRGAFEAGRAVATLVQPVLELVSALGGLKTVLSVLIGFKLSGVILSIAGALGTAITTLANSAGLFALASGGLAALAPALAPILATLAGAGAVFGALTLAKRDDENATKNWSNETQLAAIALERLNAAMDGNVLLMLDAQEARDQAANLDVLNQRAETLFGFEFGGTERFQALSEFRSRVTEIITEAEGLFVGEGFEQQRSLLASASEILLGAGSVEDAKTALSLIISSIKSVSGPLQQAASEAEALTAALEASVVPAQGFVNELTAEDAIEAIPALYRRLFQDLETQLALGLVTQEQYTGRLQEIVAAALRDAKVLFGREGELQQISRSAAADIVGILGPAQRVLEGLVESYGELIGNVNRFAVDFPEVDTFIPDTLSEDILANIRDTNALFFEGLDTAVAKFDVAVELGEITGDSVEKMRRDLLKRIEIALAVAEAFGDTDQILKLQKLRQALEDAVKTGIGDALESSLRQSIGRASDALGEALGQLIVPLEDQKITATLTAAFGSILNLIGDTLIQAGISLGFLQQLFNNPLSPAAAAAAVAAGLLLKGFASALSNSLSGAATATPTTTSFTNDPIDFGVFDPRAAGPSLSVTIQTIDASGVASFVQNNADALGQAVVYVAERDRATGGNAFGVFGQTAFAR